MSAFRGKVAVVTGGANGIGRSIVHQLARQGASVAVCDVDSAGIESMLAGLRGIEGKVFAEDVDVSDRSAMLRFAERTFDRFGAVHALFNNAGVGGEWGSLYRAPQRDFSWCMNINVSGVVHGIEAFVGRMVDAGTRGHVVNIASVAGVLPTADGGAYSPSKFAVVSLTEGLAAELADTQVTATVVCPGFVNTGFLESGRKMGSAPHRDSESEWFKRRRERVETAMKMSMSPDEVAKRALAGMLRGDLYVFTHPEFRSRFEDRVAKIREALDQAEHDALAFGEK